MTRLSATRTRLIASAAALICLSGCDLLGLDGHNCDTIALFGIYVDVYDASTGKPIDNASITITDGAFNETAETAVEPDGTGLGASLARERPGTYDVRGMKEGYVQWQKDDVRVTAGTCHVKTVFLQARLAPLP